MNVQKVVTELERLYPGCPIIRIPEHYTKEVICEVKPIGNRSGLSTYNQGTAVAVIDESAPNDGKKAIKAYFVLQGSLKLYYGAYATTLSEGEGVIVPPGFERSAEGNETWVRIVTLPAREPREQVVLL